MVMMAAKQTSTVTRTDRMDEIDSILQEEELFDDIGLPAAAETPAPGWQGEKEITVELINQICGDLAADGGLPTDLRELFTSLRGDEVIAQVHFLQECVESKGKFQSAAREKSWSNYHAAFSKNMGQVAEAVRSTPAAAWLCLRLFEKLLSLNFPVEGSPSSHQDTVSVPEKDNDIIAYIGGSVLQKVKQAAFRLSDKKEKFSMIDCVNSLIDHRRSDESQAMTHMLDRGGLIYLKPTVKQMFISLEMVFRNMFSSHGVQAMSCEKYTQECLSDGTVMASFYENAYDSWADDSKKELILQHILQLYFKIRAHHKCKKLMDDNRYKCQVSKKQKALRQSLKKN